MNDQYNITTVHSAMLTRANVHFHALPCLKVSTTVVDSEQASVGTVNSTSRISMSWPQENKDVGKSSILE